MGEDSWPTKPDVDGLPEVAEIKQFKEVYSADTKVTHQTIHSVDKLLQRYSNWHRLKRAMAIVLRLKALLRKKAECTSL